MFEIKNIFYVVLEVDFEKKQIEIFDDMAVDPMRKVFNFTTLSVNNLAYYFFEYMKERDYVDENPYVPSNYNDRFRKNFGLVVAHEDTGYLILKNSRFSKLWKIPLDQLDMNFVRDMFTEILLRDLTLVPIAMTL